MLAIIDFDDTTPPMSSDERHPKHPYEPTWGRYIVDATKIEECPMASSETWHYQRKRRHTPLPWNIVDNSSSTFLESSTWIIGHDSPSSQLQGQICNAQHLLSEAVGNSIRFAIC